jgi:hypothetical protein
MSASFVFAEVFSNGFAKRIEFSDLPLVQFAVAER